VTVAVGVVLFWPIADLIAAHDVGGMTDPARTSRLVTARDAARGRLLQLGAGVFAAGALIFTALNFNLTKRGQVTDRYTKAIEQLGSDKGLDVRIGGIYALQRIARDSASDHPTVMDVLSAFVRQRSLEQWPPQEKPINNATRRTRPDVQAAVTVIGFRNLQYDLQPIDFTHAMLTRADLSGTHLFRADLSWAEFLRANLSGAELNGAKLHFTDLTRANLTHADLTGAELFRADVTEANLNGATLDGAILDEVDFSGADLTDVRFPHSALIPEGWVRDSGSGRLKRAP
jgi:hypothetical protein